MTAGGHSSYCTFYISVNEIPNFLLQITSVYVLVVEKHTTPVPQHSNDRKGVVLGATLTMCTLVFSILLTAIGLKVKIQISAFF